MTIIVIIISGCGGRSSSSSSSGSTALCRIPKDGENKVAVSGQTVGTENKRRKIMRLLLLLSSRTVRNESFPTHFF